MLITIISIVVLAIGIVSLILYCHGRDAFAYLGMAATILGGTCTAMCIILILIYAPKTGLGSTNTKIKLEEQQIQLNSTYGYLTTTDPSDISRIEINEYNKDVAEYKADIKAMRYWKNNIWINWFVSPAWLEFNEEDVSYIS